MTFSFPLPSAAAFVERVEHVSADEPVRRWVLRDDNHHAYDGTLPRAADPAYVELHWKADARGREQLVGMFRVHLAALLDAGYARADGADSETIHVRIVRGERGVILVQSDEGEQALPIGTVDL